MDAYGNESLTQSVQSVDPKSQQPSPEAGTAFLVSAGSWAPIQDGLVSLRRRAVNKKIMILFALRRSPLYDTSNSTEALQVVLHLRLYCETFIDQGAGLVCHRLSAGNRYTHGVSCVARSRRERAVHCGRLSARLRPSPIHL